MYDYSAIIRRILAVFVSLMTFFSSLTMTGGKPQETGSEAQITYSFDNSIYYSAAGTVTVTAAKDADYDLYWGNSEKKKLSYTVSGTYDISYSEFSTVTVTGGKGSQKIYAFTSIPVGAEYVLCYTGSTIRGTMKLPDGKITKKDNSVYSFGALSDVHFNRYSSSGDDDALITFPTALSFFEGCNVSLVAMAGDLSAASEDSAYEKFNAVASRYSYPVYTCTGNHDCLTDGTVNFSKWKENINTGLYAAKRDDGIKEVGKNELDFVYIPPDGKGDVFVFFSQIYWSYNSSDSRLVTDEQLEWLSAVLEKYKDRTVYLFFHTMLANVNTLDSGTGEGNILTPSGIFYNLVYTVGTKDEVVFRGLMKKYKNVVFFNGHSHWKYEMALKYNSIANITDYNGTTATMVHLSSITRPRMVTYNGTSIKEQSVVSSEGTLVKVYSDRIEFMGIDFTRERILSYAVYSTAKKR